MLLIAVLLQPWPRVTGGPQVGSKCPRNGFGRLADLRIHAPATCWYLKLTPDCGSWTKSSRLEASLLYLIRLHIRNSSSCSENNKLTTPSLRLSTSDSTLVSLALHPKAARKEHQPTSPTLKVPLRTRHHVQAHNSCKPQVQSTCGFPNSGTHLKTVVLPKT